MNRYLLLAYVLLVAWTIGALAWTGKEMLEQHRINKSVAQIREKEAPKAVDDLLLTPEDSPLYLIQELQQEPDRDLNSRIASVLEKAIGKNPKPPDPGHVLAVFANEVRTLRRLIDDDITEVDTSWLTEELRNRLKDYHEHGQLVLYPEQQAELIARVKPVVKEVVKDLSPRLRQQIDELMEDFIKTRWASLDEERLERLANHVAEFIRLRFRSSTRQERERLLRLTRTLILSRSLDLSPEDQEWLAGILPGFIAGQLPQGLDQNTAERVKDIVRDFVSFGWAPLVREEKVLWEVSKRFHKVYEGRRRRVARALVRCITTLVEGETKGDIDRVVLTELISLLGDPDPDVARAAGKCLLVVSTGRMRKLIAAYRGKSEFIRGIAADRVKDVIILMRKALLRETVPSVMVVPTRQKTKEERKKELVRLLVAERKRAATVMGQVGAAAKMIASERNDPVERDLLEEKVLNPVVRILRSVLGSPQKDVAQAARNALKALDVVHGSTP